MKMLIDMAHLQYHLRYLLYQSHPESLVNQNEIVIDSLCYVPNDHEDVNKYGSFAIPS